MKLYSDPDIAKKVNTLWDKARDKHQVWRDDAKEDFNFVAGHQWDEADIEKLKLQNRPVVTFNRCNPILSAILGMEANQRQQTAFNPRGNTDSGLSEAIDFVADWARDYAETEIEEAQSFEDMLTCGMGWIDTTMDYESDLDGKIIQSTLNPLQVEWDWSARKRNLTDAEWVCFGKRMSTDEIKEKWPDVEITISEDMLKDDDDEEETPTTNVDPQHRYETEKTETQSKEKKPVVLKFQWFERVPVYRVALPMSNEIMEMDEAKYNKVKDFLDQQGAPSVKLMKRKYYQAFIYGETLLEKTDAPCQSGFSLKCITGKRDKVNNTWYGIVRLMKDPQRWANKFFSTFIDIIDSNAKGGLMVEEGAVSDVKKFEDDWGKADSITWVRPGAIANGRIQPKPAPLYPQSVDRLLQFAIQSIYDCTGMNMEMLGMADRAQANALEENRKKSAYTILAPFFDSFRTYRKESGMIVLEYIKNYLPLKKIAEVLEPEMKQYAQVIKNMDLNQMNVVVSESPQSDNHKMIVWAFISQVVPQLMKMGVPVPPEIFEYSPLPSPLVEKWKKMMGQQQLPPQVQQKMQQMQEMLQQLQQENQKLKMGEQSKLQELALKKNISEQELQIKREEIRAEYDLKRESLAAEMEQFIIELKAKMDAEVQKSGLEIQAKKEMHKIDVEKEMIMHSETMKHEAKTGGAKNAD